MLDAGFEQRHLILQIAQIVFRYACCVEGEAVIPQVNHCIRLTLKCSFNVIRVAKAAWAIMNF